MCLLNAPLLPDLSSWGRLSKSVAEANTWTQQERAESSTWETTRERLLEAE